MCVIALSGVAPCQCFSPGGHETTSPGWISSAGPPELCTKPRPAVTMSVWPSGWVCQAARAPGSKVTLAPCTRPGALAWNSGSTRTFPVNDSFDPSLDDREPPLLISISFTPRPLDSGPKAGAVDHEPVAHVAALHACVGVVDLLDGDDFYVRDDLVLAAVVEHLLGLGNPADVGTGEALVPEDERARADRSGGRGLRGPTQQHHGAGAP